MKTRLLLTAAAAAGALAFTACSPVQEPRNADPLTVPSSSEPTITDPQQPTPTLTPRTEPPVLAFGETFAYSDGISVTVSDLGARTVELYSGPEFAVPYEITITNDSAEAFDPAGATSIVSYGQDGLTASTVTDMDLGWEMWFIGTILPGRSATITTGYAIPPEHLNDVVFQFMPEYSFDRGAVFYLSNP